MLYNGAEVVRLQSKKGQVNEANYYVEENLGNYSVFFQS